MKPTLTDADVVVRTTSRRTAIAVVFGGAAALALTACRKTTPEPTHDPGDAEPPPPSDADAPAETVTDPAPSSSTTQGGPAEPTGRAESPTGTTRPRPPIADSDSGPRSDVAGS